MCHGEDLRVTARLIGLQARESSPQGIRTRVARVLGMTAQRHENLIMNTRLLPGHHLTFHDCPLHGKAVLMSWTKLEHTSLMLRRNRAQYRVQPSLSWRSEPTIQEKRKSSRGLACTILMGAAPSTHAALPANHTKVVRLFRTVLNRRENLNRRQHGRHKQGVV